MIKNNPGGPDFLARVLRVADTPAPCFRVGAFAGSRGYFKGVSLGRYKGPYEFTDLSLKKKLERDLESREEKETKKRFKICLMCKTRKSIFHFSVDRRSSDGRVGACKICKSKQSLKYYYENQEEILSRTKEYSKTHLRDRTIYFQGYQEDNKAHLKKIAKAWYKKNKKAIKKRNLQYYQENREACLAIRELWREKNKEGIKKYNRQYKRDHKILKTVIL